MKRFRTDFYSNLGKDTVGVLHIQQANFVTNNEKVQKDLVREVENLEVSSKYGTGNLSYTGFSNKNNTVFTGVMEGKKKNTVLFMEVQKLVKVFKRFVTKNHLQKKSR
jgi:hypothetical protein